MSKGHKFELVFAAVILFTLFVNSVFAQYPDMQAAYHRMAMQDAQMHMNAMEARMLGKMNANELHNFKYFYHVTLKDSSTLTVESAIYTDTALHKDYLLLVDKKYPKSDTAHRNKKIYSQQTLGVMRIASSGYLNHPVYINGLPTDTCWLFKAVPGTINMYSYLSEKEGIMFQSATIVAIQLNDGPIVKFEADNLKKMILQDKDALEYFDKKKYYKAIKQFNKDNEKKMKQ